MRGRAPQEQAMFDMAYLMLSVCILGPPGQRNWEPYPLLLQQISELGPPPGLQIGWSS